MERLRTIRMGINETVDSYWGRMRDILLIMGEHQSSYNFLKSIFIGGLYPFELKVYVKEHTPNAIEATFRLAKAWEESRIKDRYTFDNYNYDLYDWPNVDRQYNPTFTNQHSTPHGRKPMVDATQFNHSNAELFVPPKAILKQ